MRVKRAGKAILSLIADLLGALHSVKSVKRAVLPSLPAIKKIKRLTLAEGTKVKQGHAGLARPSDGRDVTALCLMCSHWR